MNRYGLDTFDEITLRGYCIVGVLAINGGEKQVVKPYVEWPVLDEKEIEYITKVTKSGKWWRFAYGEGVELKEKTSGDDRAQVVLFQEEFAKYHDAKYALACANGSAAIEICLKALGIGPGDEVIVPPYTFISTATSVLHVNAVPIFVDIEPDTYNMDPNRIEEAITDKTKAIIPVHFAGQACDMDKIMAIAKKHGLYVIEDCAHAHGAEWKGRKVGSIGHAGTFSFQASKTMTSGEGGIITTNDKDFAIECDSLIWIGRKIGRPWYEFHRLGWNYRITEFQGAILRAQLTRLDEQVIKRTENADYLTAQLKDIEGIMMMRRDERATKHGYYMYMFRFDEKIWGISRDTFQEALMAEGVDVFKCYPTPIYNNPVFLEHNYYTKGCPLKCPHYDRDIDYAAFADKCPVAEKACREEAMWLNHRMFLGGREDMDGIVAAIKKIKAHAAELQ